MEFWGVRAKSTRLLHIISSKLMILWIQAALADLKSCWLAAQLGSKKDLPEFCFIAPATSISTTQLAAATYRCKFLQSHDSFFTNSLHHLLWVFTTSEPPPPTSSTSESTLVCFPRLTFSERHNKVNPIFAFLVQKWEARLKRPHADPHRLPFFQTKSAKYHLSWTIRTFHLSIWFMKTTFSFLCANLYYLMHLVYYTRFLSALAALYLHR